MAWMQRRPSTICWNCKNAVPDHFPNQQGEKGCSWSLSFIPVDGWEADKTVIRIQDATNIDSYIVHKCPLFEEG